MAVLFNKDFDDHEHVAFIRDAGAGLTAIIAIHNTTRGPALGGCRYWTYRNENDALRDALRLSRGMTYKAALADLPYGGGKTVVLAAPGRFKDEALMRALGRAVHRFGGSYVVAEDVGTSPADMEIVRQETPYVAGLANGGGDPAEATAFGVWHGIRAAVRHRFRANGLGGIRVAVQGLGHVGWHLCKFLHREGAQLLVGDIRSDLVARAVAAFDAVAVDCETILSAHADVLAPCALGSCIDDHAIVSLRTAIVAGSANNQLAEDRHGEDLAARNILYAPDYVINAGGLINVHHEISGNYERRAAFAQVARIEDTLDTIFIRAAAEGHPPHRVADQIARERLAA